MHFRQYVLISILIGTAIFFSTNAYAEEADHTPKQPIQSEKVAVQKKATGNQVKKANALEKAQTPKKLEKPVVKKILGKTLEKKALPEQANPKAKAARQATGKKTKQADSINTFEKKLLQVMEKRKA